MSHFQILDCLTASFFFRKVQRIEQKKNEINLNNTTTIKEKKKEENKSFFFSIRYTHIFSSERTYTVYMVRFWDGHISRLEYCNPRVGYPYSNLGTGTKMTRTGNRNTRTGRIRVTGLRVRIRKFVPVQYSNHDHKWLISFYCLFKSDTDFIIKTIKQFLDCRNLTEREMFSDERTIFFTFYLLLSNIPEPFLVFLLRF